MIVKSIIHKFNIKNTQGFQSGNLNVPSEAKFPPRSPKQQVCFSYQEREIFFDLIYYKREELRQFKLVESKLISKDYLNKLSVTFLFNIMAHSLADNTSIAVIPGINQEYGHTCYGAIKKVDNQYYFMVYAKKGTTNFEDDTIYVYGIWEVILPKKVELELFSHTNKPV